MGGWVGGEMDGSGLANLVWLKYEVHTYRTGCIDTTVRYKTEKSKM